MKLSARWFLFAVVLLASPSLATDVQGETKLRIHGYLSQAYGWADIDQDPELLSWLEGGILGLDEDGTTDYRTLALQIRYEIHDRSAVVFQFDHERLGAMPQSEVRDDVEVDWAFFTHLFKQGTSIRVGRLPLPWGIYNEIRDVGTLLPFFRPVDDIYLESESFDESFNGLQISHGFFPATPWALDVDVFGGQSNQESTSVDSQGNRVRAVGSSDRFGFRLWLETPVTGLTFGFGLLEEMQKGGLLAKGEELPSDRWMLSLRGDFERFVVRSEYMEQDSVFESQDLGRTAFEKQTFYVETAVKLYNNLELLAQYVKTEDFAEIIDDPIANPLFVSEESVDVSSGTEYALGLRYGLRLNVVVRAEYHWREEAFLRFSQLQLTPRPDGRLTLFVPSGTGDMNFGIISMSVSF